MSRSSKDPNYKFLKMIQFTVVFFSLLSSESHAEIRTVSHGKIASGFEAIDGDSRVEIDRFHAPHYNGIGYITAQLREIATNKVTNFTQTTFKVAASGGVCYFLTTSHMASENQEIGSKNIKKQISFGANSNRYDPAMFKGEATEILRGQFNNDHASIKQDFWLFAKKCAPAEEAVPNVVLEKMSLKDAAKKGAVYQCPGYPKEYHRSFLVTGIEGETIRAPDIKSGGAWKTTLPATHGQSGCPYGYEDFRNGQKVFVSVGMLFGTIREEKNALEFDPNNPNIIIPMEGIADQVDKAIAQFANSPQQMAFLR